MNRGSLIGGIVCLALAVLLAILNWQLPADKMMFMIGDRNAPMVPVAILAAVGVALIVGAFVRAGGRRG
jgi:heme A synthase